jgi:hypothetical protein
MHAAHVNLGDLPTWLAVVFAAVAAVVAFRQLRAQQRELTRQLAALERQQADQVDVYATTEVRRVPVEEADKTVNVQCWELVVINRSRRPVRNVEARIDATGSSSLSPPDRSGWGNEEGVVLERSENGKTTITILRAGLRALFLFEHRKKEYPEARMVARFTDDAGLNWQIDHDMHLMRLEKRNW